MLDVKIDTKDPLQRAYADSLGYIKRHSLSLSYDEGLFLNRFRRAETAHDPTRGWNPRRDPYHFLGRADIGRRIHIKLTDQHGNSLFSKFPPAKLPTDYTRIHTTMGQIPPVWCGRYWGDMDGLVLEMYRVWNGNAYEYHYLDHLGREWNIGMETIRDTQEIHGVRKYSMFKLCDAHANMDA